MLRQLLEFPGRSQLAGWSGNVIADHTEFAVTRFGNRMGVNVVAGAVHGDANGVRRRGDLKTEPGSSYRENIGGIEGRASGCRIHTVTKTRLKISATYDGPMAAARPGIWFDADTLRKDRSRHCNLDTS